MEKAAKATLRHLKEVCLRSFDPERNEGRDECYDDITTMVTLSAMALQSQNTTEDVHSISVSGTSLDSIRALLETVALEGLQELGTREISTNSGTQHTDCPYKVGVEADDFWSHCYSLSLFSSNVLNNPTQPSQIVSSMHHFSLDTSCLLTAFLSVGKAVLNEQQILHLLSHLYDRFWSQEAKRLAEQITLTKANEYATVESGNSIAMLARMMTTLYCLFSVHCTVKTSLLEQRSLGSVGVEGETKSLSIQRNRVIDQWLCPSVMDPLLDLLTAAAPKLLLTGYQGALELDKKVLHVGADLGEAPDPEHLTVIYKYLCLTDEGRMKKKRATAVPEHLAL